MTTNELAPGDTAEVSPGITKTVLPNGVRVVTETMPHALSVTLGFWVGVGSRDESEAMAGASHFLEHLLFKGTEKRSALDIAMAVDAVGGEMNAFTAREHTAYYARLPSAELQLGLDLLSEVISEPSLRPDEVDGEREVILEEILMNEDTPEDVVHTELYEALFPDHPLGRETLGTEASIEAMERDQIAQFFDHWYQPANLVIAAAGALEHAAVVERARSWFGDRGTGTTPRREAPSAGPEGLRVVERATEQAHVTMAWRGLGATDPERYALAVGLHVLGGGPASRLFQEVREKRGLAYSVYASSTSYSDTGSVVLYAGTVPSRLDELIEVTGSVLHDIVGNGISVDEHRVALGYLEGSMLLGLEDSGSRMMRLGMGETIRGHVIPIDLYLERLRAVTIDDVAKVITRVLGDIPTVAAVGPFDRTHSALAGCGIAS